MQSPRLYATFLLWLLSELFDELPEIGDQEKPKLVFFFDEAHLLFNDAPKALLEKIELVVRLIRSKGVGVYFVSQNPLDVPDIVLAQIGNRVQHALRAFTPRDTKAVKAAADTFRVNPEFSTFDVITQLGTGEALVSTLEEKGVPSIVQRTLVRPPSSRIGAITPEERAKVIAASPVGTIYDQPVDRESAFERLKQKVEKRQPADAPAPSSTGGGRSPEPEGGGTGSVLEDIFGTGSSRSRRLTPAQRAAREATRTAAGEIGKAIGGASGGRIMRSILGGLLGR
jgi:DNA helicase HerA-like ATPase